MIKKIILAGVILCLFIAIPLSIMGYDHVTLGQPFMALMKSISSDMSNFKIEIPDIPNVPKLNPADYSGGWEVLFSILNVLVDFINGIVFVLNLLTSVINIVISLLQFIFLLVKNLITFKDTIAKFNPII